MVCKLLWKRYLGGKPGNVSKKLSSLKKDSIQAEYELIQRYQHRRRNSADSHLAILLQCDMLLINSNILLFFTALDKIFNFIEEFLPLM
jgi:hypothetical protein